MNFGTIALICAALLVSATAFFIDDRFDDATVDFALLQEQVASLSNDLKHTKEESQKMKSQFEALTRQMMLQQLFVEERIRSEGQSGIKQTRNGVGGTKSYHLNSHLSGERVVAIHDHSNNIRTVGMGEFIGVLNGVEFRTRHNDYRLYMPSRNTTEYHKTEDIPFPDVPPEVEEKESVDEQIEEMIEWFKAWKNENHTVRDYRKYFKPLLCYLEGTWTKSTRNIDEPFESDRHFVDATSWFDLQEKIRFTSYTGRKDNSENFAYLPTTIIESNETTIVFAQWNYRILCHPLKNYLPVNRLRVVDNLASRLSRKRTLNEHLKTRAARFQINIKNNDTWRNKEKSGSLSFLDELMSEIPGKDNYPANIRDDALGQAAYSLDSNQTLNAGYYHRRYKVLEKGAMGIQTRHRGFSDPSLFVAMTTQRDHVAGMKLNVCKGSGENRTCTKYDQKVSYAIPLEIIYLTPLNKWNPHNLTYRGDARLDDGKTVTANRRNGGKTKTEAYDGLNSKIYYITPNKFFTGKETNVDAADTTEDSVGVLDKTGKVRHVRASGVRIFLPNIPGVGILRQRYPIMPIHVEGSTAWKEIQAVGDLLMKSKKHARLFRETLPGQDGGALEVPTDTILKTGASRATMDRSPHYHEITLTKDDATTVKSGGSVLLTTTQDNQHQHSVTIQWNKTEDYYYIAFCDGKPICEDEHPVRLTVVVNE